MPSVCLPRLVVLHARLNNQLCRVQLQMGRQAAKKTDDSEAISRVKRDDASASL